ncbi:nitrogen fixation protein NifR [Staphylococcus aureus]|nr:nitrogen fixation protein NifR [Staphylococcus aureus]
MAGPQHREFQKEILQTMQVGDQRNKFYENIISVPLPIRRNKDEVKIYEF